MSQRSREKLIRKIFNYNHPNPLKSGTILTAWISDKRWNSIDDSALKSLYKQIPLLKRFGL